MISCSTNVLLSFPQETTWRKRTRRINSKRRTWSLPKTNKRQSRATNQHARHSVGAIKAFGGARGEELPGGRDEPVKQQSATWGNKLHPPLISRVTHRLTRSLVSWHLNPPWPRVQVGVGFARQRFSVSQAEKQKDGENKWQFNCLWYHDSPHILMWCLPF